MIKKDLKYNRSRQLKKFAQYHIGRALDAVGLSVPKFTDHYRMHRDWTAKYLSRRDRHELSADEINGIRSQAEPNPCSRGFCVKNIADVKMRKTMQRL